MRIAAITNSRIPSTTANSIQAVKVCDALVQGGHEVRLIAPAEAPATGWERLSGHYGVRHPFEIFWLPSRPALKRFDFVWYALSASRTFKPDLIYTWLPQSAAVGCWQGFPVVLEMHADVAGRLGPWWLRQFWRAGRRQRLLVTTQALRRALEKSTGMGFPDSSVQIAPNGVDLDRYADLPKPHEARARLHLVDGLTAGFTGHFYAGRGISLLFELARSMPTMNFLWVGGTAEAVEEWRAKLNAVRCTNVTLTGFVDNSSVPLYQAAADILLMPYGRSVSASSGQDIGEVINPMKMFEYMAAQRPIVTSDLPVIREVLDETRAVFCPADDALAWKRTLDELGHDGPRRERLARSSRQEVEKYTWLARANRAVSNLE
jgi:glycosyltransferase involved in cell wall biosynthesis